jgi:sec-independent protein translocase protein TatA
VPNIGATELIILLVVVLLLFGSARLPKLARSIGEASREFKKGVNEAAQDPESVAAPDEKVSMSRAELDAMLAEREARARRDASPPG